MKLNKIIYWITTVLVAVGMLMSGVMHLTHNPQIVTAMQSLGYPLYVCYILGTAKVLGALALLVPGFPRTREWAYAGFTFLLLGAAASHLFMSQKEFVAPVIFLVLLIASYITRRKLAKA